MSAPNRTFSEAIEQCSKDFHSRVNSKDFLTRVIPKEYLQELDIMRRMSAAEVKAHFQELVADAEKFAQQLRSLDADPEYDGQEQRDDDHVAETTTREETQFKNRYQSAKADGRFKQQAASHQRNMGEHNRRMEEDYMFRSNMADWDNPRYGQGYRGVYPPWYAPEYTYPYSQFPFGYSMHQNAYGVSYHISDTGNDNSINFINTRRR